MKVYRYKFRYTDGSLLEKEFNSIEEVDWFVFNEGDHLQAYSLLEELVVYDNCYHFGDGSKKKVCSNCGKVV